MDIGSLIDASGVDVAVEDGDLVDGIIVLAKVVESDGMVRLAVAWSDGMSWLERKGMISAANDGEAVPSTFFEDGGE